MAYLKDIVVRKCADCPAKATVELFTWQNYSVNFYCSRHGRIRDKAMNANEQEDVKRRVKSVLGGRI